MRVNLLINQGETFQTTFTVLDGDEIRVLTGYTAASQMRKHYSSNSAVAFGTTVNGVAGTITLSLSATQSANMDPGRYMYDCIITSNNVTTRVFEGTVTLNAGVTR